MLPIFLDLKDRPCLVVGGGTVALRKIHLLLQEGAKVTVVSPKVDPEIERLASRGQIRWYKRLFRLQDVDGMTLVFCATNHYSVNRGVAAVARRRGVPVNVADDPDNCDFYLGSVARRGRVTLAVSTSGLSPALARHLRRALESAFPPHVDTVAEALGKLRPEVRRRFADPAARAAFWRQAVDRLMSRVNEDLTLPQAEQILREMLNAATVPEEKP